MFKWFPIGLMLDLWFAQNFRVYDFSFVETDQKQTLHYAKLVSFGTGGWDPNIFHVPLIRVTDIEPEKLAVEYFSRIRGGDISVVDLFHDDASLIGLGTVRSGREEVLEFYKGVIERAGPSPSIVESVLADESRAAAELVITFPGGQKVHAVDVFKFREGRIESLSYYLCARSE